MIGQTPLLETIETARLAAIELLIVDCDGVLTDGRVWVDANGNETKAFSVIDGHGLLLLKQTGVRIAMISRDRSGIPRARAEKLRFDWIFIGIDDKRTCLSQLMTEAGVDKHQIAYIGDDVPDLEAFPLVGLSIAPSSGHPTVIAGADAVTSAPGGQGAAREVCDLLVAARRGSS